jgi:hypothetical protein
MPAFIHTGRPKGTKNKSNRTLREHILTHVIEIVTILMEIARRGDTDAARVIAARELLDRGFGKPGLAEGENAGQAATMVHVITRHVSRDDHIIEGRGASLPLISESSALAGASVGIGSHNSRTDSPSKGRSVAPMGRRSK